MSADSSLMSEFVYVIEELRCFVVGVSAVEVALARLDHHHHPTVGLSIFTPEQNRYSLCPVWSAAASI